MDRDGDRGRPQDQDDERGQGGDIWEVLDRGMKDLKVKKGDKVTVYYVAIAKKIESK